MRCSVVGRTFVFQDRTATGFLLEVFDLLRQRVQDPVAFLHGQRDLRDDFVELFAHPLGVGELDFERFQAMLGRPSAGIDDHRVVGVVIFEVVQNDPQVLGFKMPWPLPIGLPAGITLAAPTALSRRAVTGQSLV